jgi:hypothetical protein
VYCLFLRAGSQRGSELHALIDEIEVMGFKMVRTIDKPLEM